MTRRFALTAALLAGLVGGMAQAQDKTSRVALDFSERFRFVAWDNAIDLNNQADNAQTFTRHRTSLGLRYSAGAGLALYAKVTNEFRYYFKPDDRDFTLSEVIVDNLYLAWNRPGDLPLSLCLGRQNLMLGEGFVVMDGHPLDGSRSIYFNAVRVDWLLADQRRLTFFATRQPRTDDFPVINSQDQPLVDETEEGFGLYYSGQHRGLGLDFYAIRKNLLSGVPTHVNTLGFRGAIPVTPPLSVTAEAAYQWGELGTADRQAWGGYIHADYNLKQTFPAPSKLTLGLVALSGDDPDTPEYEGWDAIFSRWPKWSESYIYALIPERGVANWSNLISLYGTLRFDIAKPAALTLTLQRLAAQHAMTGSAFPGGDGTTRGLLLTTKLDLTLTPALKGHVLWDVFNPGDYYTAGADRYNWFRVELLYNWRR